MRGKWTICSVVLVLVLGWGIVPLWAEGEEPAPAPVAEEPKPPVTEEPAPPAPEEPKAGEEAPKGPEVAKEGEAKAPAVKKGGIEQLGGMTVTELLEAGGACGWVIIALSVIGLGLVFENFYSVRRSQLLPPEIVDEVERLFQEGAYEEALELCDAEQNLLTNMVGAALSKIAGGYDEMMDAMGAALEEGATALNQKVNYLNLIGNVAPMLGLLGTVQGMIMCFMIMAAKNATPKPAELADSIGLALVTTLDGLIVAIPILSFHMFLKNRVTKIVMEAQAVGGELLERFKTK